MGETLKVGGSFDNLVPAKLRQPDGTYGYILGPDGIVSTPQRSTVMRIVERPEDEAEATQLVKNLLGKISINQNVVDGKLFHTDNPIIGHLFDPNYFYIIET